MTTTYRIGEAASRSGLTPATIRFYEDIGLLERARRSDSGYRTYGKEDLRKLRLIANARALGIAIDDIAALMATSDLTCTDYVHRLRPLVERQRTVVAERMAELHRLEVELDSLAEELGAAEASAQDGLRVSECTCCPLIDEREGNEPAYCTPPAPRLRIDPEDLLDVMSCDIGLRPAGAPGPDDLAPFFRSASTTEGRFVAQFDRNAAETLRSFAAAESLCCSGITWRVDERDDAAVLTVDATPDQTGLVAGLWSVPDGARLSARARSRPCWCCWRASLAASLR